MRREPGRGEDVGAALAFEEEGEPEGERGAVGWVEGWCWALGHKGRDISILVTRGGCGVVPAPYGLLCE